MKKILSAVLLSTVLLSTSVNAAIITSVDLTDFTDASVLDFNSATLGDISGTSALFANFGISSISASSQGFGDSYGLRTNSSRALWFNASGLQIVDPGAANLGDGNVTYTINFTSAQNLFGFGIHDQGQDIDIDFFSLGTSVGSATVNSRTADLFQNYFSNTDSFDSVMISMANGFALDNLTIEASVSEPSMIALVGLGILGFGFSRRKS